MILVIYINMVSEIFTGLNSAEKTVLKRHILNTASEKEHNKKNSNTINLRL